MQVNLKQSEIEAALRQYISAQGINLKGKDVKIAFTAGRKDNGISAEIDIEDIELPDFTAEDTKPESQNAGPSKAEAKTAKKADAVELFAVREPETAAAMVAEPAGFEASSPAVEEPAAPVKTVSLFN